MFDKLIKFIGYVVFWGTTLSIVCFTLGWIAVELSGFKIGH